MFMSFALQGYIAGKKSACKVRQDRLSIPHPPITYFSLDLALLFHGHKKRPCPTVGLGARLDLWLHTIVHTC